MNDVDRWHKQWSKRARNSGAFRDKQCQNGRETVALGATPTTDITTPTTTQTTNKDVVVESSPLPDVVRSALLRCGFEPAAAARLLGGDVEYIARVAMLCLSSDNVRSKPAWITARVQARDADFRRLGAGNIPDVIARLESWLGGTRSPALNLNRAPPGTDAQAEKVRQLRELAAHEGAPAIEEALRMNNTRRTRNAGPR